MAIKDFNSLNSYIGPPGSGGGSPTVYSSFGAAYRGVGANDEVATVSWLAGLGVDAGDYTGRIKNNDGSFRISSIAGRRLRASTIDTEIDTVDALWRTNSPSGAGAYVFQPDGSVVATANPANLTTTLDILAAYSSGGSVNAEMSLWLDVSAPGLWSVAASVKVLPIQPGGFSVHGVFWQQPAATDTVIALGYVQGNSSGNSACYLSSTYTGTGGSTIGGSVPLAAQTLRTVLVQNSTGNNSQIRVGVDGVRSRETTATAGNITDIQSGVAYTPGYFIGAPSTTGSFTAGFDWIQFFNYE